MRRDSAEYMREYMRKRRRRMKIAKALQNPDGDAPFPLLDEFRAATDKKEVIREALSLWRNAS